MRNLIILGSGRSGTSALAGLFRMVPNVFYGYDVLAPTQANPRGYFEDEVVNAINNLLIRQMTGTALLDLVPRWLPWVERCFPWMHRDTRSLWLACPRRRLPWRLGYDLAHLIGRITSHQPFCFKDPRFSFTLPLWQHYLPEDTRFLVVFRDPTRTVNSMLRDAKALYERPLPLTKAWAVDHWNLAYRRILEQRSAAAGIGEANWLVVRSDDLINGAALPAIERFAECVVNPEHIDADLMQATPRPSYDSSTAKCTNLYRQLRAIAEQDLGRPSQQPLHRSQTG